MKRYSPKDIESKWQKYWDEHQTYKADLDSDKQKYFAMSMFNYPSGAGIHIGHAMNYTISDVLARFKRQQGYESYHPVGWDAFGLPAENYAIKSGVSPQKSMATIIPSYHKQYKAMGWSNDWSKEISTHEPEYYKWTQWIFSEMYRNKLAYQDARMQWWCAIDNTVLANEQVIDGKCWRHDGPDDPLVEKKEIKQWFFKITDYADELLEATDALEWTETVKTAQKNWIGKSKGAEIDFAVESGQGTSRTKPNFIILHGFTGRADKDFIPYLKQELEVKGFTVQTPQMPNTDSPTEEEQVSFVLENCTFDENTILVGHSLGCAVSMKVLEKLSHNIAGLVLIASVVEPDFRTGERRNFWDNFSFGYDYELIKQKAKKRLLLSDTKEKDIRGAYIQYLSGKIDAPIAETTANGKHFVSAEEPFILDELNKLVKSEPKVKVFTTRPDTIFGATFLVLAPEHELVSKLTTSDKKAEVEQYVIEATRKTEVERQASKEKTGVFTGSYVINPVNNGKIPVWVADYVLVGYGTGAIMAVPGHDERDNEFAKKFDLPIIEVVEAYTFDADNPPQEGKENTKRNTVIAVIKNKQDKYLTLKWHKHDWQDLVMGGVESGEDVIETAKREITEETGYTDLKYIGRMPFALNSVFYAAHKDLNRDIRVDVLQFELESEAQIETKREQHEDFEVVWVEKSMLSSLHPVGGLEYIVRWVNEGDYVYTGEGRMVNSGDYSGIQSSEAREKIVADLAKKGLAEEKVTYKIRDWSVSRQRYWGAPIPIIHCEKCGPVLVPDEQLPVVLPELTDFAPSGDGRSALARATDWLNVECPECGGPGERETDTLDTYICSSWYMLRYTDPHNDKEPFSTAHVNKWMPVDFYNGADHATAHMIYARFVTRFFHKLGLIDEPEPFKRFLFNGKVTAQDGQMFSKSKGNGVDPLEIINSGYGADALRVYLMFAAPLDLWIRWDPQGVPGAYRFLNRVWNIVQEFIESKDSGEKQERVLRVIHPAIQKTTADIEDLKYNTAIATLMKATNDLYELKAKEGFKDAEVWKFALESLVMMIGPFAPHAAEELWHELGHKDSIHRDHWPQWDEKYLVNDTITIAVQVNGKLRGTVSVAAGADKDAIIAAAQADEKVKAHLSGEPKKTIYVPGKLVNFVV